MAKMYRLPLMYVQDIMSKDVVTVNAEDGLDYLIEMFQKHGYHGFPVVDDSAKLVGVARDSDILRMFTSQSAASIFHNRVKDIMRSPPATLDPDASITEALHSMFDCYTRFMPVVEGDTIIGVLTRGDILNGIAEVDRCDDAATDVCEELDGITEETKRRGRRKGK